MTILIRIPSKTFLFGEYAVLAGGPCLVAATLPEFQLTATPSEFGELTGIASDSPAGRYWSSLADNDPMRAYQLSFQDPHHGQGGFGASTAQYAGLIALRQLLIAEVPYELTDQTIGKLLQVYQQFASHQQGLPPSGADLLAQFFGQLVLYDPAGPTVSSYDWPFPEWQFLLLRTGHKQATHEHLVELALAPCQACVAAAKQAAAAFIAQDGQAFLQGLNAFQQALESQQLLLPSSHGLLQKIRQIPEILFAKGCGALGADVLFVLLDSKHLAAVTQQCLTLGLEVVASDYDLAPGTSQIAEG